MALKTYGAIVYDFTHNTFRIERAEPHVCIKLKSIFRKINKSETPPFVLPATTEVCADLHWFTSRYPMEISLEDSTRLLNGRDNYVSTINELETILLPSYQPQPIFLNEGYEAREYQIRGSEIYMKCHRLLLGDDLGLGKTLTAILSFLNPATRPGVVVVQTHMTHQWKNEGIEKFTNLKAHIIKGTRVYNLPPADVYILKYSCLSGWVDFFGQGFFKSAVFDEIQELRKSESNKYQAGRILSESVQYCLGLSATPIYNYGEEIYNVLDVIKPDALGSRIDFLREWTGFGKVVHNPQALGTYLRESFLFLRRTRQEVGRELPPINKIVHTVGYDEAEVRKADQIAKQLAMKIVSSTSFMERGQAARELDLLARYTTGISKAKEVAEYVKILLLNDEPVVLAGWHRDVYEIWLKELGEFKPVMYTGSESPAQKEKAKQAFMNGETNLFIISLRSGAGLDGLQHRCKTVVVGELDWSPKVHDQLIARVDRDGQQDQVTAIFLVSDSGSDPVMIDLLGLKASQAHNIIDPLKATNEQYSDESRMKQLAEQYLKKIA